MGIKAAKAQAAQVEYYKRLAEQRKLQKELEKLREEFGSTKKGPKKK